MADLHDTGPLDADAPDSGEPGPGLGRRQALGLFGAATAAAWAAPQILSVPAASAATVGPGGPAELVAVGVAGTVVVSPTPPFGAPTAAASAVSPGWVAVGPIGSTTLNGVASDGVGIDSTWVAVGTSGMAYVSDDPTATTWTPHFTPTESTLYAITWTGTEFVAVGSGGVVVRSSNGTTWSTVRFGNPQAPALRGVASDGTTVVAVGDDGTVISALASNLSSWTTESSGATGTLTAVTAAADGTFVAVGQLGPSATDFEIVVRATDGTWTPGASDTPALADDLYGVATGTTGSVLSAGGSTVEIDVRNQDPPDYATSWPVSGPNQAIEPIRGVAALPGSSFVLVGLNGQIAIVDSDFQLVAVPSPTTSTLNAVAAS